MINIAGIASVIIFYLLILGVGLWAARKNEGGEGDQEEEVLSLPIASCVCLTSLPNYLSFSRSCWPAATLVCLSASSR